MAITQINENKLVFTEALLSLLINIQNKKEKKTRMVYNYKRLNDNTHINGYTIPSKDVLINRIQKAINGFQNLI